MKLALAIAAALLAALVILLIVTAGRTGVERAPSLALGGPTGAALELRSDPVGLSVEYQLLARELGAGACPPPALVRAIRGLGAPALRIGGDSQDRTAPAGSPPHPGASDLAAGFWARLGCLERETHVPVVVGLNVAAGEPAWAATMAAAARAAIPRTRLAFELGNEPDLYGSRVPWWNGRALVHAPMPFATYRSRARAVAAAIGPGSSIEGPDFASGRWVGELPALARELRLDTLDAHFYPLDACDASTGDDVRALLSRAVTLKVDERVRIARDARDAGLPALISESNSVACGGLAGVSDSPAAGVWAFRLVLEALRTGFRSVRFHSSGGAYDPFALSHGRLERRPIYRALALAARLLTPGTGVRRIDGAHDFDGVALVHEGTVTYVLSNYEVRPRAVSLPGRGVPRALALVASGAGSVRPPVRAGAGRAFVTLPPDSLTTLTVARG